MLVLSVAGVVVAPFLLDVLVHTAALPDLADLPALPDMADLPDLADLADLAVGRALIVLGLVLVSGAWLFRIWTDAVIVTTEPDDVTDEDRNG